MLVEDLGLVPGNRVLLRAPNSPMHAACWFAVLKAGGIAVGTMPLLRAKELTDIITKAGSRTRCATCASPTSSRRARPHCPSLATHRLRSAGCGRRAGRAAAGKAPTFASVDTAADDTALIAFTSGTTGKPKGTMHFHRDVIAVCDCWPRSTLRASARRRLHGQSAARVHVRPGRAPAVSAADRRLDAADRAAPPGRAAAGDRRAPRDRAVHGADVLSRDGAEREDSTTSRRCASAFPPAKRFPPRRAACGRTRPASRSSTASAPPRCSTSSSRSDEAHAKPGATGDRRSRLPCSA